MEYICFPLYNDVCLQLKCKKYKSGGSGCFITISDITKQMKKQDTTVHPFFMHSISSASVSSDYIPSNKSELETIFAKNRDFYIPKATTNIFSVKKPLSEPNKQILLDDFFNNKIGFKIFYNEIEFKKEIANLNILIKDYKDYITDYTTLYAIENNFAFIIKKKATLLNINSTRIDVAFPIRADVKSSDNNLYIITYKNCKSSLSKIITNYENNKDKDKDKHKIIANFDVKKFMNDISPIMSALHKSNKAHMDIKPGNIVYCNTELCKTNIPCFKIIDLNLFDLNLYNINTIQISKFKELLVKENKTKEDKILISNIMHIPYDYLLHDIIRLYNLMYNNESNSELLLIPENTLKIPENVYINYMAEKNYTLSYLFKKSDEYAFALILNEISLLNKDDKTIIPYIRKLTTEKLYFENLK